MTSQNQLKLGRIAGVEIRLNWSVLVIVGLLTWSLATVVLPSQVAGATAGGYWAAGLFAAIGLLVSILVHELAHALVAQRHGISVESITLWLFGGVARLEGEAPTPAAEAKIAGVGPAVSVVVGVVAAVVAAVAGWVGLAPLAVAALWWLALINAVLAVFNLVPGAPLDGGRLLHAFLWHRHGDRVRATVQASKSGVFVGYALMTLGIVELFVFGGLGGLWTAMIGWFLVGAARQESSATVARAALGGVLVRDIMTPRPDVAPDWITVDELVHRYVLTSRHTSYPVESFDGRLSGLVTLAHVKRVPAHERRTVRVRDIATPLAEVVSTRPEASVVDLLEQFAGGLGSPRRALVFGDENVLVGIVTSADLARAIEVGVLRGTLESDETADRSVA